VALGLAVTVQVPTPGEEIFKKPLQTVETEKVAITLLLASIVKVQPPVPVQAPDQLVKV